MRNCLKFILYPMTFIGVISMTSCVEEIDKSDLYTFKGQTITDYIAENEEFSHFYDILKCIDYDKILSAYGAYTCFVPSNEGVVSYADSLYNDTTNLTNPHNGMQAPGLVGIIGGTDENGNVIAPNDSLCYDIALFHLLYSKMLSIEINKGNTLNTMMNRDIITSTGPNGEILINGYSKLQTLDVELENGIVHTIDHVIRRSNELITQELGKHKEFSIFSDAMNACGMADVLVKLKRDNLIMPQKEYNEYIPQECRLGYTIFAESNDVFNNAGIQTLEQLIDSCRSWYADCHEWYDYYRSEGIEVSTGNGTVRFPENFCENLVVYNGSETKLCYLSGQNIGWANYQGDEMNCVGAFDFALRLPPVPEGLYEVRMGYSANGKRGMMQIYLGNSSDLTKMTPIDIPLDMRKAPSDDATEANPHPFTGWCNWQTCADYGIETDINMRNLNFMRGPLGYTISGDGKPGTKALRSEAAALRRIILKDNLKQGEYWLRFKTMLPQNKSTQFHLEYIELVPENVYNNAQYLEDMY